MDFLVALAGFLEEHWLIAAFLAPLFWATVNVIDAYLVKGIYNDEWEGAMVTGFFQFIPFFVLSFFLPRDLTFFNVFLGLAVLAGFLFNFGIYFYYKALFRCNDVALLQVVFGFIIILVPFLSFVLWGEKLSSYQVLGIGVVFLGALLLSFSKKLKAKFSWSYLKIVLGAVFFFSLSMVCADQAYANLPGANFLVGFWAFSLGAVVSGGFLIWRGRINPLPIIRKYFKFFVLLEGVNLLGNLAAQNAIAVVPSVVYVAVAETFQPVFIMVYSLLILFIFGFLLKKNSQTLSTIYREQLDGVGIKILATVVMALGVFIMTR